MFNFLKKKKKKDSFEEYLTIMFDAAKKYGYNLTEDGYPYVPEIQIKYPENITMLLNSDYMKNIPTKEFTAGAYNAMRFCFAFGVILADVWHTNFSKLNTIYFSVEIEEIISAMDIVDLDRDQYEALIKECMDGFVKIINTLDEYDLRQEFNYLLIATQVFGSALYLKKNGFN